ncbi:MAG: hypothetical protein A2654_00760 [Candidatus Nealsonbacteria bacterium RIFCSPHIGHO2_01_FULL_43_31]|uniref:Uncharacterized protein n=2 Tax=Candidatus Nealsoniibacteriota TaxID=1817911 RepID=A0A1G2E700_9BACT|nr:MAG: hypothetical protein UV98_C0020G0003 [Parcubacteria group bacterium GW2011_GWB1_43_6]OGZ19895.1 MAG: hypothetical protein A2654_00760 [Candidatus Nealsonbacteria bacterium RIFCSPHIGHO2_01_FULL_43_31]OGZ21616.1 MAG: hypothetical protein A3D46_01135 [Candidatus Nealsonbacteria bacterium RIFCSPHIGHO2_02_FULL_43_13]OGZ25172.1 MAG: hypothetical protein A2922_00415 [Candidatus Nealsonbacteria bacterium RIFCSPLOWO2_01_FULL_43_36]
MSWEQILGFFTMWPNPAITVGLWAKAGVPIWQTIAYVVILTSISLSLTYFGVEWLKNWVVNRGIIERPMIEKLHNQWRRINRIPQSDGRRYDWIKKTRKWLIPQKDWQILAWGFVPFIPILPTIVIIITNLRRIKYGFLVLILGNIFRNVIFCYAIYEGRDFFLQLF